jgi:hypothetical protein
MWQHIEPDRLLEVSGGSVLNETEAAHMVWCEFCQAMMLFFVEHRSLLDNSSKPDVKAA